MKACEKQTIFNLLKTAAGAINGFVPESFCVNPVFSDDMMKAACAAEFYASSESESPATNQKDSSSAPQKKGLSIEELSEKILRCTHCQLARTRTNVVPGEGVPNPDVLVIGEGPGYDEDMQGRPFVGKAGALLDKMLSSIGLDRNKNCFITNIVKCRPPMNRDPLPDEAAACRSFLDAQIHVLKPKLILAMGRVALHNLLDTSIGITRMHGQFVDFNGIPFMATFHPSALLRDESYKRPAWEDLKKFRERLLEIVPDYV